MTINEMFEEVKKSKSLEKYYTKDEIQKIYDYFQLFALLPRIEDGQKSTREWVQFVYTLIYPPPVAALGDREDMDKYTHNQSFYALLDGVENQIILGDGRKLDNGMYAMKGLHTLAKNSNRIILDKKGELLDKGDLQKLIFGVKGKRKVIICGSAGFHVRGLIKDHHNGDSDVDVLGDAGLYRLPPEKTLDRNLYCVNLSENDGLYLQYPKFKELQGIKIKPLQNPGDDGVFVHRRHSFYMFELCLASAQGIACIENIGC